MPESKLKIRLQVDLDMDLSKVKVEDGRTPDHLDAKAIVEMALLEVPAFSNVNVDPFKIEFDA